MAITYGPFASGAGASVGQDDYFDYLGPMLQGDGVNSSSFSGANLQVYGNSSGLQVLVRPGSALIRGSFYRNTTGDTVLTIQNNSSGSTRIDRVVLTHNRTSALITPTVITGTPGGGAPAYTQTAGGVWQIPLAQVTVASGAAGINPGDVNDERQYLPLRVGVCDTRYATPPADGSQGRVFYDKNPTVLGLIATDGTAWTPLRVPDTGWQNLTLTAGWTTEGYGPTVRKAGSTVMLRGDITGSFSSASQITTLPAAYRPAYPLNFPANVLRYRNGSNTVINFPKVGTQLTVNPDGSVVFSDGVGVYDLSDSGFFDLRAIFNVTYLAG
jgi:hypothetical protein